MTSSLNFPKPFRPQLNKRLAGGKTAWENEIPLFTQPHGSKWIEVQVKRTTHREKLDSTVQLQSHSPICPLLTLPVLILRYYAPRPFRALTPAPHHWEESASQPQVPTMQCNMQRSGHGCLRNVGLPLVNQEMGDHDFLISYCSINYGRVSYLPLNMLTLVLRCTSNSATLKCLQVDALC